MSCSVAICVCSLTETFSRCNNYLSKIFRNVETVPRICLLFLHQGALWFDCPFKLPIFYRFSRKYTEAVLSGSKQMSIQ